MICIYRVFGLSTNTRQYSFDIPVMYLRDFVIMLLFSVTRFKLVFNKNGNVSLHFVILAENFEIWRRSFIY